MFGHTLGLRIVKFPSGRYGFVGRIPAELGQEVPASTAAVMGQHAYRNAAGEIVELKFPSFETSAAAAAHARLVGHEPAQVED